jgi:hypothetical protein
VNHKLQTIQTNREVQSARTRGDQLGIGQLIATMLGAATEKWAGPTGETSDRNVTHGEWKKVYHKSHTKGGRNYYEYGFTDADGKFIRDEFYGTSYDGKNSHDNPWNEVEKKGSFSSPHNPDKYF